MRSKPNLRVMMLEAAVVASFLALLVFGFVLVARSEARARTVPVEEKNVRVTIDNFAFSPATLTIPVGTKVTWVNRDDVPHNVVSTDKKFKSDVLDTDQEFSFTFTETGTYDYYCSLHPKMIGKVIVQ